MTVATRSAYPRPVDDLLPAARTLAAQVGEVPSRNRLMREFRIGAPKADELRALLLAPPPDDVDDQADEAPAMPEAPEEDPPAVVVPTGPDPAGNGSATFIPPVEPTTGRDPDPQVIPVGHPDTAPTTKTVPSARRRPVVWPVLLLALPAFVAIWAGWVDLGRLTGFGEVALLPGIADSVVLDTAITLPVGMETYAAYALWVWLSGRYPGRARRFARWSAIVALAVGAGGQVTYHLMAAAGWTAAPWPVTALVACLPVAVLGMGAALAHLARGYDRAEVTR